DRRRARASRGLPAADGARRDQRHDGRPAGALGRIQILRRRPRVRPIRDRGVRRTPGHPRGRGRTLMSKHAAISPAEAADRLAMRELVEAYVRCADRRDAKGQMSLFTEDTHFVVYMNAKAPAPSQELHSREALAPVFADLNKYDATTHFVGQSTILTLGPDRATGEAYCLAHHITIIGEKRRLMAASLRYNASFVKTARGLLFAARQSN